MRVATARYDAEGTATAQATRTASSRRRPVAIARSILRLTGLAMWRGVTGIYHGNDLTFASSIAYYSLLSLFPFFLLSFSIIASVTSSESDRAAVLGFVLRYFPRQFEFVTVQLDALQQAPVRLGLVGSVLMIWAAMGVFGAITSAINHAWG